MSKLTPAAFSLALVACASPVSQPSIQYAGGTYGQLTGESLRSTIIGKMFSFPKEEIITSARCNVFNDDGTYAQCGDRAPIIQGRYVVEQNQVCATLGQHTTCWQLFGNPASGYLVQQVVPSSSKPERVCLKHWDQRMEPCF